MTGNNNNGNKRNDAKSHELFDASPDDIEIVGDDNGDESAPQEASAQKHRAGSQNSDLEALNEQLNKIKGEYLYLRADFDNYRKQAIKERSDLVKYGAERFVVDLLEVVDNFDRALTTEVNSENYESFKQGMEMIASELSSVLDRHGVEAISSKGKPFDPNVHEALSSEPTKSFPPGHVTQEIKKAYQLHNKLIRPAQVVVATEVSAGSHPTEDESE